MIRIEDAVENIRPKSEWNIRDGAVEWLDTTQTQPSEAEIQAEITRLQTEYDSNLFQRQRADDYPSLQDQADMQYWDSVNGTTTWLDAINEIKTRYPKP
jgi:hypothetical protein